MTGHGEARQQMQTRARDQAIYHLIGATVHAVAAENHHLARTLVEVSAEQANLWTMVQLMTARCAHHLHTHREDTLNGVHFWAQDGMWTFEDITDMDGPVGLARMAAARLVTVIAYNDPSDASTWKAEWMAIWDAAGDPEVIALVVAGMVSQTYPELRIPTI